MLMLMLEMVMMRTMTKSRHKHDMLIVWAAKAAVVLRWTGPKKSKLMNEQTDE